MRKSGSPASPDLCLKKKLQTFATVQASFSVDFKAPFAVGEKKREMKEGKMVFSCG